jgi:hypothetical protein
VKQLKEKREKQKKGEIAMTATRGLEGIVAFFCQFYH